jgi:hypothetical protein
LFGPFLLWKVLNSSLVDPNSAFAWLREIGGRTYAYPGIITPILGLWAACGGGLATGILAVLEDKPEDSAGP